MKTFSDRWRQLDWDDIRLRINGKTAADVERALNASQLTRDDMMALLSPAASGYLEQLAQRAQRLTRQRFGNTVSFYVPLYLSNLCTNWRSSIIDAGSMPPVHGRRRGKETE